MFVGKLIIIFSLASLLQTCTLVASATTRSPHPLVQAEYCLQGSFNVTCPPSHVILMTSARYGRMHSGKCISVSYGHVGCSTEVTSRMDEECSGRERCEFPVTKLLDEKPCPPDLTSYLEVTHKCIPVVENKCGGHHLGTENLSVVPLHPPSLRSGYLVLFRHIPRCPWQIVADKTQRIKFILYSFSEKPLQKNLLTSSNSNLKGKTCPWSIVFQEQGLEPRNHEVDVCSAKSRENFLYTSRKNTVVLVANHNKHLNSFAPYLLKFEAIGCPSLLVPKNAWIVQDEHRATVKCNFSDETWFLACNGHEWNGEVGNCSKPVGDGISIMLESSLNKYNPLPIAVIVGVVLGIVIGSVPLALVYVCLRRKWREQQEVELHHHHHHALQQQHQTTALCTRDTMSTYCTEGPHCLPLTSKDFCRACPMVHAAEKQKLHAATLVNKTVNDDPTLIYGVLPAASSANNNRMQSTTPFPLQSAFNCCSNEWLDRPDVASMTAGQLLSNSPILPKNRKGFDNSVIHTFGTLSKAPSSLSGHRFDIGNHPVA